MKEFGNISLPGEALPAEDQPVMSVPAPRADTTTVSVTAASSECAYRVCGHFSDFFCTVKSELLRAVRALRSFFRPRRKSGQTAPTMCCGYSRTILGWRL